MNKEKRDKILLGLGLYIMAVIAAATLTIMWLLGWIG